MKLPIPLLLYTVSTGLVGVAGWQAYEMLPLLKKETRDAATGKGIAEGTDRLALGKGSGPITSLWKYSNPTLDWWSEFKAANFLGKLPPPPVDPAKPPEKPIEKPVDVRPLEQIIELVSLVYDSKDQGKGEISHVIVRYKQEANVQPPEWYVRETTIATTPAAMTRGDVPPPRAGGNPGGPQGKPNPNRPPTTPMPSSTIGRDVLQKLWIQDGGNPRRDCHLWGQFADIKLVRVRPDALAAFFVRTPLPPKEGEPAVEPKEVELLKSSWGIDQALKRDIDRINGLDGGAATGETAPVATTAGNTWIENEETTQVGKVRHIGRKDEKRFREAADDLLANLNVDTFVGRSGRGLRVLNVEPELAARFGVAAGEVLLSVNGRAVTTKVQAMQFGKGEYQRGVRTFVTRWLSGGQEVERIYQAPDR